MAEPIVARDLMLRVFDTIREDQTLREAMRALVQLQDQADEPNALVVVGSDGAGRFLGVLTARLLFKSLLTLWMPGKAVLQDETRLQRELLAAVQERSGLAVRDALIRDLPTANPEDRLLTLIDLVCDRRLEFLPVVDDGKVCGLVPVTAIFAAAASLALTPEHEGIHTENEGRSH